MGTDILRYGIIMGTDLLRYGIIMGRLNEIWVNHGQT